MDRHAARLLDDEQPALLVLGDDRDRTGDDGWLVTMRDVAQQVIVADHVGRIDLGALYEDRAGPNRMFLRRSAASPSKCAHVVLSVEVSQNATASDAL